MTLPRHARSLLIGAALLIAALGISGTAQFVNCPECLDVQWSKPCPGCLVLDALLRELRDSDELREKVAVVLIQELQ